MTLSPLDPGLHHVIVKGMTETQQNQSGMQHHVTKTVGMYRNLHHNIIIRINLFGTNTM